MSSFGGERKREGEEFDYRDIFHPLSLSLSICPSISSTCSLPGEPNRRIWEKTNMRDYMSQKHTHEHKSKQTH